MSTTIIILVIALIIVILGLLLSGTGSNAGLGNISAQDLEIFKKTKDRGIIKILQFIMFIALIALAIAIVVVAATGADLGMGAAADATNTPAPAPEENSTPVTQAATYIASMLA